jgi:hypothetical protein
LLRRRCGDILQHVAPQRPLPVESEQLQHATSINLIGLRRCREDFLVACQLQIVDVVQPPAAIQHLLVERTRPAVITFHGHPNVDSTMPINALEEPFESCVPVVDAKLLEQGTAAIADRNLVKPAAHIHCHPQLVSHLLLHE